MWSLIIVTRLVMTCMISLLHSEEESISSLNCMRSRRATREDFLARKDAIVGESSRLGVSPKKSPD